MSLRYQNINMQLACLFFVTMPSLVLSCYSILYWAVWHSWVQKGICSLRVLQFECHTLGNIWKHATWQWVPIYMVCFSDVWGTFSVKWFFFSNLPEFFHLIWFGTSYVSWNANAAIHVAIYIARYLISGSSWRFIPSTTSLHGIDVLKIAMNLFLEKHISCLSSCVPSFVDAGFHIGFTLEFCLQWEVLIFFVFINLSASN